jgi:hypothetical protein
MNDFSYAIDANIKRYRNLLKFTVDETKRRTIQGLLTEEVAKHFPHRPEYRVTEET